MGTLTILQQSNYDGFPKAAELIEIEGDHALEASDISAVKLTWRKKAGDEFRAAMQERNQSKQGRKARLESAIIPSSTTKPQLQLI
jgi:hypothetical protein